ncbi:MAG: rRNA pseudouridine synthase [Oscillospiraceae bacterium]|nr:rRNA pseudouridine synthase [Oscillospiraceae bacterium]
MALLRLDKYLSDLGIASRREVKELLRSGRVTVDGAMALRPEQKLDPALACVELDGRPLIYTRYHYYMMNKPEGVITATEDRSQRTVLDLLPPELRKLGLFPVGRLDKDTAGLLILTDDGDFSHRVAAPKSGIRKRYLAEVDGVPDETDAAAFREGLVLGDGTRCLPAELECSGGSSCYVTVQEGKYHQVKRMLAARGKPVRRLCRLSVGGLELDKTLEPGAVRALTEEELCTVFIGRK